MSRIVAGLLLVVLGTTFGRLVLTGGHTAYVRPGFGWIIAVSAIAAFALGTHQVISLGGQDLAGHHPKVGLLFLVPLATLLVVAPGPLGAFAAQRSLPTPPPSFDATSDAPRFAELPAPRDGAVDLPVAAAANRGMLGDDGGLDGARVRLTGFATTGRDGEQRLARMVISCCAADATVAQVALEGGQRWEDDTWLEIEVTYLGVGADEGPPRFSVESATVIEPPAFPYE